MPLDFYVSPDGNDQFSGRLPDPQVYGGDGPFASFVAARDAARASPGPNRIVVRGGDYHLGATVEFDARDAGLVITSAEGESPVIFGGPEVVGWRQLSGSHWVARMDLPETTPVRAVFLDGRSQPQARHPNLPEGGGPRQGWLIVAPPKEGEEWLGNLQFRYRPGDVPPLSAPAEITAHIVGGFMPGTQWGSDTLPVTSIDTEERIVHTHGTAYFFTGTASRYFLAGAQEFLDAPREWWFDARMGDLHYIAAEDSPPPPGLRITAGVLPSFFRFSETRDLVVNGLEFRDGAPEGTGKVGTDTRGFGAIRLERAAGAIISGNRFENIGVAIHVAESPDVVITGNEISHLAGNGIYFGTNWGSFGRSDNGTIIGNRISDVGEVYFESAGITFQSARHLRIALNTIERTAQFGIAGGSIWGEQDAVRDVVIEHNTIRNANLLTADGGAIKMMGVQATPLSSVIRHNVVTGTDQLMTKPDGSFWPPRSEDTGTWPSPISWAIYLDGRASGVVIERNWLDRNVAGIGINGGWNNLVRDNVIRGGAGCAFRIDDATGRDWRPDWAEPNRIEKNFVRIDRPDGQAVAVHSPGHGSGYVTFSDNRFTGNVTRRSFQGLQP